MPRFDAPDRGQGANNRGGQENGETQNAAYRTQVRPRTGRIEIGQEMKLSSKKEQSQQQADKEASVCAITGHLVGKTQLRRESLLGQGDRCLGLNRKQRGLGSTRLKGGPERPLQLLSEQRPAQ